MKFKAYICSLDAEYHIPDDYGGINIYFSKKSLKDHKKCIGKGKHDCKVVEIEIEVPRLNMETALELATELEKKPLKLDRKKIIAEVIKGIKNGETTK